MTTPIRLVLDFSSHGDFEDSRQNSLGNPSDSGPVAAEEQTNKKSKKKKKKRRNLASSSSSNRIWNEEDEVAVLKGLVDYRVKTGFNPKIDWDDFYRFVRGSIVAKVSKDQVLSKIKKLKRSFVANLEKINQGHDPLFTRSTDSEAFGFSMMIWGKNDDDGDMDNANQIENGEFGYWSMLNIWFVEFEEAALQEDEEAAANAEPLTEDGAAKSDSEGTREIGVDTITVNETAGEESHGDEADELCVVRDAFETTVSHGLREYQKRFHLEKLMNLGTGRRRELSNEWKALCVEESRLKIRKLRYSAKLAEAANDN